MLRTANDCIESLFRSVQNDGWFGPAHRRAPAPAHIPCADSPNPFPAQYDTDLTAAQKEEQGPWKPATEK